LSNFGPVISAKQTEKWGLDQNQGIEGFFPNIWFFVNKLFCFPQFPPSFTFSELAEPSDILSKRLQMAVIMLGHVPGKGLHLTTSWDHFPCILRSVSTLIDTDTPSRILQRMNEYSRPNIV
jgi:hypothetical protein